MNSTQKVFTSTLFATPTFISGAARVLDLGALFDSYNTSSSGEEADSAALQGDWRVTGRDLWEATKPKADSAWPEV